MAETKAEATTAFDAFIETYVVKYDSSAISLMILSSNTSYRSSLRHNLLSTSAFILGLASHFRSLNTRGLRIYPSFNRCVSDMLQSAIVLFWQ